MNRPLLLASGLCVVAWLLHSLALAQAVAQGTIAAYDLSVTFGRVTDSPRIQISIEDLRRERPQQRLLVEVGERPVLRIHDRATISVMSITGKDGQRLTVIDARSSKIEYDAICSGLRLTQDGTRYLFTLPNGQAKSFVLATRELRTTLGPVEGAVQVLERGALPAKLKFLATFETFAQLNNSPIVRQAIVQALAREIDADWETAQTRSTRGDIRKGAPSQDYLATLLTTVASFHDPSNARIMVRADHLALGGALAKLGPEAAPYVVKALEQPVPPGYSKYYRMTLLQALTLLIQRFASIPVDATQLTDVTAASLTHPLGGRELLQALDLTSELTEDDALLTIVRQLVSNPSQVAALGITDARETSEIDLKLKAVLASRVVVR